VPKLKVNGVTLISKQEKTSAIAKKLSRAHEHTVQSPLSAFFGESCLYCTTTGSTLILRPLLLRGRSEKLLRDWKVARPLGLTVFRILFSRICPVWRSFIWLLCFILVKLYYFPKIWKHASVTPIPKLYPSNYRPISLLSSISKVFERIILRRLNGFISTVNILMVEFGFRVVHSTSHQLTRVARHVNVLMVCLKVPFYLISYIISAHPMSQPRRSANLPHFPMILLFLFQT
jgi:hypothetical protein